MAQRSEFSGPCPRSRGERSQRFASVGSKGDSYDNALAETVNGLYKTELIRQRGPWRTVEDVELATLGWVDWYNQRRLHGACNGVRQSSMKRCSTVNRQPHPRRENQPRESPSNPERLTPTWSAQTRNASPAGSATLGRSPYREMVPLSRSPPATIRIGRHRGGARWLNGRFVSTARRSAQAPRRRILPIECDQAHPSCGWARNLAGKASRGRGSGFQMLGPDG
jgi:hypothetical protein